MKEADGLRIEADLASSGDAGLIEGLTIGFFSLQTGVVGLEEGQERAFAGEERLVGHQRQLD